MSRKRWATASTALLMFAGCALPGTEPAPGPPVVQVTMDEYAFAHEGEPRPGRVVFRAHNTGDEDHEIVMALIPEGVPPILEQLRGTERTTVATLAQLPAREPDEEGTFAVDLARGRYAFLCFIEDGEGTPHALRGMAWEFEIR